MELTYGSNIGDNFLGIIYRVTVTGKKIKREEFEEFKLICKLSPTNASVRDNFCINAVYKREILFYNEILPLMTKLQEDSGIVEDSFNYVPYVYATSDEEMKEFLIMEDLREDGYTMFNRFEKIDLVHSELVMSALGKFHALSFALRDKHPEIFQRYKKLTDIVMSNTNKDDFIKAGLSNAISSLNNNKVDLVEKMETVKTRYKELFNNVVNGSKNEPYSVLTHGDTWINNMMFKDKNGIPSEIKLLDWQNCKYASPVLDILHYIFICTENPFRSDNYDKLLNIYFESLSKFLIRLDCNPEKLFPYEVFQNQLQKFGIYGLLKAVLLVEIILQKSEDCVDLTKLSENREDKEPVDSFSKIKDIYNVRMADIVGNIDRLGYFDILNLT